MHTGRARLAVLVLVLALVQLGAAAPGAGAQIAFAPCGTSNEYACGHLDVPIDPSGATPGTITLAIRRHRAPLGEARSAIVALAGGPGQPALPLAEQFVEVLGPLAATRDVIVFDQRGTGLSHALGCHAFERPDLFNSIGSLVSACAGQLGPTRRFFTSADSVADIEAIREAGGYEKLLLYGTSYGTKVAELYAEEHPEHVEGLVLDSVVAPNGPDPLSRSTFAAVSRILEQLCARDACAGITRNPVADLERVVGRSSRGGLTGIALDGDGNPHRVAIDPDALLALLLEGDFSPQLRAEFVTDVHSAARGDLAPLARLLASANASAGSEHEDFDNPLYYATTCEEQAFPWNRAASPHQRLAEAVAAVDALPRSAFAPFDAAAAVDLTDLRACAGWPFPSPLPPTPSTAPLPAVPTLVISGEDDLRTPTADARALAAQLPGAHLLVVPYTGHSVLGEEPTACAREAMIALFGGSPGAPGKPVPAACPATPAPADSRPPPLPPARLADVSPERGSSGAPGRTLHAVALSLADFGRQLALAAAGSEGLSVLANLAIGGLRSGWARLSNGTLVFHDYSYVPGVTLSGRVSGGGRLAVGGTAAAAGTLAVASDGSLSGTLGGARVSVPANAIAAAAIVRADEQASLSPGAPPGAALARLLSGAGSGLAGTGLAGSGP